MEHGNGTDEAAEEAKLPDRLPLPHELAAFARECGIEQPCRSLMPAFFDGVLEEWKNWRVGIEEAAQRSKKPQVSIEQCMKQLETSSPKTMQSWLVEALGIKEFPHAERMLRGIWKGVERVGIPEDWVDDMRKVRDKRATDKASKAGFAKAAKQRQDGAMDLADLAALGYSADRLPAPRAKNKQVH